MRKQRPDYKLAEAKAAELLEKYDIINPPVNPVTVARDEGYDVKFAKFSGKFATVSGFYDHTERTIYVNKEEDPSRQTFTIAHELAHAILHADWAATNEYKIQWRDMSRDNDRYEREANAFAAHLLVPRKMLDRYYKDASPSLLSKLFLVSGAAIKNRLNHEYKISA